MNKHILGTTTGAGNVVLFGRENRTLQIQLDVLRTLQSKLEREKYKNIRITK